MIAQFTSNLDAKEIIAENTYKLVIERPRDFDYIAGQYVFLDFPVSKHSDNRPTMRAMSIASAPQENCLMFIMRGSESAFKKNVAVMEVDDEILIKGPIGQIALPDNVHTPVTFIVAGMGITPARAMIKHEEIINSPRPVTLLYANRTKESIALKEEMESVKLSNYKVVHTLTREEGQWDGERGRVDAEMIKEHVDGIQNQVYYVVGTGEFIESMKSVLEELGVDKRNIHFDNFG